MTDHVVAAILADFDAGLTIEAIAAKGCVNLIATSSTGPSGPSVNRPRRVDTFGIGLEHGARGIERSEAVVAGAHDHKKVSMIVPLPPKRD